MPVFYSFPPNAPEATASLRGWACLLVLSQCVVSAIVVKQALTNVDQFTAMMGCDITTLVWFTIVSVIHSLIACRFRHHTVAS